MRIHARNATAIPYVSIVTAIRAQPVMAGTSAYVKVTIALSAMATLHSALIATEICHVMSATETVLSALHATAITARFAMAMRVYATAIHAIYAIRTTALGVTATLAGNATGTAA
jgi:hypothetical protein